MSKVKTVKVANQGQRVFQLGEKLELAPKKFADLEAAEAKKLAKRYPGEIVLVDQDAAKVKAEAEAAEKEADAKIAELEAKLAEAEKAEADALEAAKKEADAKIAELEKQLEDATKPAEAVKPAPKPAAPKPAAAK